MTRIVLLEYLRDFTKEATADLIMPTKPQKGDAEQGYRPAAVYLMRLPDSSSATKRAPYVLHQLISGADQQKENHIISAASVRSVFCVYNDDKQEGGLMLLNLMERLRVALLQQVIIGEQFTIDLDAGLNILTYSNDTAPYFAGEMISTWKLPTVKREILCPK